MVNIPSNITSAEDAKHWLRVNGYSAEKAEALAAEWSASSTPVVPAVSAPAPSPVIEEDEEDWDEDEDEIDEEE